MKKIAIMQPTYIPWIGYFDLMDSVDVFVYFDDTQMRHRYWDVRNRIRTQQGEIYLTVPVSKKVHRDKRMFCNSEIIYEDRWIGRHIKSMTNNYRKTPFFEEVIDLFKVALNSKPRHLSELNIKLIYAIKEKIGIKTKTLRSSSLLGISGKKDVRLVNICKKLSMDTYVSPIGSSDYINSTSLGGQFIHDGINLFYQNYQHPVYKQNHSNFLSHMSVVDILFNYGFENSLDIIRSGRRKNISYDKVLNI